MGVLRKGKCIYFFHTLLVSLIFQIVSQVQEFAIITTNDDPQLC